MKKGKSRTLVARNNVRRTKVKNVVKHANRVYNKQAYDGHESEEA